MSNYGWIGVDLDGTLAEYGEWVGVDHIGRPIPLMVARVKQWLADGQRVKIFTARVSMLRDEKEAFRAKEVIELWCKEHLGVILEITCTKDYAMKELWDDRCVQVIPNTGQRVDGISDQVVTNLNRETYAGNIIYDDEGRSIGIKGNKGPDDSGIAEAYARS